MKSSLLHPQRRRLARVALRGFKDDGALHLGEVVVREVLRAVPTVRSVRFDEVEVEPNAGVQYDDRDLVSVAVSQEVEVLFTDGTSTANVLRWSAPVNTVTVILELEGVPATDIEAAEASARRAADSLIQRNFGRIENNEGNALHLVPAGTYTTCSDLTFESTSFTMRLHDATTDEVLVAEKFSVEVKLPHRDYGVSVVGFGRLSPVGGFIHDAIRSVVATHQGRVLQHENFSVNQVNHFNDEASHVIAHFGLHAERAKAMYQGQGPSRSQDANHDAAPAGSKNDGASA